MKNTGKIYVKVLSFIIAAALVFGIVPVASAAGGEQLKFGVISDVHYYPEAYSADTPEFEEFALSGNKQYVNQEGILNSMMAFYEQKAQSGEVDFIIIPGDLTRNGEYQGHVEFAAKMEAFEKRTGIPVFVINGNHDINNHSAASFANGVSAVPAKYTSPEEFREIYKNLGYDMACATYTPPKGEKAGMLSYAVEIGGYRFIFIDGGRYSVDNTEKGLDSHETAGNYSDGVFQWALGQIAEAKKKGQIPIGVDHWSLAPHYDNQDYILQGFVLDNWKRIDEAFADAGLHFMFTGHSHSNDVSQHINDNGEILYDIQTNSLIEFPHYIRTACFTRQGGEKVKLDYVLHEVDEVLPVIKDGVPYEKPYRQTVSFNYCYRGDVAEYAKGLADPLLANLFAEITETGGLVAYLNEKLDLEDLIFGYIGALTPNAMAFINDLGAQIDERYIKNPEYTLSIVDDVIEQLCDLKVSDLPCRQLYDEYGYENPRYDYGTFGDAALVVLAYMGAGDEALTDPFMLDVIEQFENGDLGEKIFDFLYDVLVHQLVEDEILSNLYVNLDTIFAEDGLNYTGAGVQAIIQLAAAVIGASSGSAAKAAAKAPAVKNGMTYLELANAVLVVLDKTGVLAGGSIDGALGAVMDEYLTESQYKAWGRTFAYVIKDFCTDPEPCDSNGTLSYNGKVDVPVTAENYRKPQIVAGSLGNNTNSEYNISWYSKYSLPETDIEVIPYSANPVFSGKNALPNGVKAEKANALIHREFPGVDLGIIGILPYDLELQRHTVKLSGLESGKTYLYRVGSAERGWWSDVGVIKTADGSDETTFLHITDSQGQNEWDYAIFAEALDKAYELYPDTDLVVHSGDMVDYGSNVNYWRYFFDSTDNMQSSPIMPVAGNHEAKGDFALTDNFLLPDHPDQDETLGVYYSFDYNNIHFMMLNTNDTDENGLSEAQLKWLKRDAKRTAARWKIVVLHKATYSNGSHFDDKDVVGMREQFASLMPQLGIDMVLQGHDHVYLRTGAMNGNEIVEIETTETTYKSTVYETMTDVNGTVYAITGASGCKNYTAKSNAQTDELFPRADVIVNCSTPVFAGIRVDGSTLYYDAYTLTDGEAEKIDSFALHKDGTLGDADGDGFCDLRDVNAALEMAAGITETTETALKLCDFDCNGVITTDDARRLLRYVSKTA